MWKYYFSEIETLSIPAAELEDSSGTLQYILPINVAECSVILVGLWIKDELKLILKLLCC